MNINLVFFILKYVQVSMKKNIIVIFGGKTTEHDISILSAMQVIEALDKQKYQIYPIYITKQSKWFYGKKLFTIDAFKNFNTKNLKEVAILPSSDMLYIKKIGGFKPFLKIDCAFIIMHGLNGEDGSLQGLMELANIPYSSSGILASCVGIDKNIQKQMFENFNIPIVPYLFLTRAEYEKLGNKIKLEKLIFPVIVKPNRLGSSIGISVCRNQKQLNDALKLAFKFDDSVVIEKMIKKMKEINISVLGYKDDVLLSTTEQPITNHQMLTFTDKYCSGAKSKTTGSKSTSVKEKTINTSGVKNGMQSLSRIVPANIDEKTKQLVETYAKQIFLGLKCKGVIRIDFIFDETKKVLYVNEVNTIPGSLAFYLWEYKGISFTDELDKILEIAYLDYQEKNLNMVVFESNVIK